MGFRRGRRESASALVAVSATCETDMAYRSTTRRPLRTCLPQKSCWPMRSRQRQDRPWAPTKCKPCWNKALTIHLLVDTRIHEDTTHRHANTLNKLCTMGIRRSRRCRTLRLGNGRAPLPRSRRGSTPVMQRNGLLVVQASSSLEPSLDREIITSRNAHMNQISP